MTYYLRVLCSAGAFALALGSLPAMGQSQIGEVPAPQVPAAIQMPDTSGGVMPATGCSEEFNVGATAFVPYTTDYYFFLPSRRF